MTAHLLALTVGPVQEFISAARRTRDLWFGSYVLSEISKAAARAVHHQGGRLIFPAPLDEADLAPDSPLNVANVILADVGDSDPAMLAAGAKKAARSCWRTFSDSVFQNHRDIVQAGIWNDQVDDVIEFYAAWHRYSLESYRADRVALMRLLAARKRCRDFMPARGRAGVPKSSLDGLRESVLWPATERPERSRRKLRLRVGEQLDVIGVVKRGWAPKNGPVRYPSVARVAADPWLRRVPSARLEALREACGDLGGDVIHPIDISAPRGHPQYAAFPFEGSVVFRSRHAAICEETELSESALAPVAQALASLTREYGEPSPYLGVLIADGDRMGQALSNLTSPDQHRQFSEALSGFAAAARQVVDHHHGILVYAGGDDVLAFLPVDRCLDCARALHDAFDRALASWSGMTGTELTLSVGLAIAHFMEPLADLLGYGRAAEAHAKRPCREDGEQSDRNGLAVHLIKRGGGPLAVRAGWSARPDAHLAQLAEWIRASSLSGRTAYDMRKIADIYDTWRADLVKDAIQRDVLSVMQGKEPRGGSRTRELEALIRARVRDADSLRRLTADLLVSKAIAAA